MTRAIRGHLRSNIVGYVSLFVALTMGSAYALDGSNTVFSDDIVNGEVKSVDVLNNAIRSEDVRNDNVTDGGLTASDLAANAVGTSEVRNDAVGNGELRNDAVGTLEVVNSSILSGDVADGSLNGADINEASLGTVPSAATAATAALGGYGRWTGGGSCDPESASYADCAIVSLNLPAPARVLLIGQASAYQEAGADVMSGECQLVSNAGFILPNSRLSVQSLDHIESVGLSAVTGVEAAGNHDYAVDCNQGVSGAIFYQEVGITAVALSAD